VGVKSKPDRTLHCRELTGVCLHEQTRGLLQQKRSPAPGPSKPDPPPTHPPHLQQRALEGLKSVPQRDRLPPAPAAALRERPIRLRGGAVATARHVEAAEQLHVADLARGEGAGLLAGWVLVLVLVLS